MPKNIIPKREQMGIERLMLSFYFLCNLIMTIIGLRLGWSIWLLLLTDAGWLFGVVLHGANFRTYEVRARIVVCMMHLGAVVWSVCTGSLAMTVPVLSILAVMIVIYGIPEIVYISAAVSGFLCIYHLLIQETVDLSSGDKIIETVLEIVSLFLIHSVTFFLTKKRLEGNAKQMEIITSLKEAERSKDDFMANVSHEIRTPINTICGMSEIVLREELTEQVRADVFSIQTAGRHLQSVVSDVLDFTEMQSGKMVLAEETYNITSTVNDVINMSMARKSVKQVELIVDCDADLPSSLVGDEQKIRRIIMNLVNNALKFTAEGYVSIHIGARKTDYGVNLVVRIKDTGIGMKKESMEKLFTTFNQVDTKRNRQEGGIGLGLAISLALVDMMGGFITVTSEFGKGTEIQFVVPQKVVDPTPMAVVQNRESVNIAIYFDMERYHIPEVREEYTQVLYHMIEQLKVKCHVCQNLAELKRRSERETFTHIFIGVEEYAEDREYYDNMSQTAKVVTIIDRINNEKISNHRIQRLYKPFFILPIVTVLNNDKLNQEMSTYYYRGKFIAPDATVLVVDDNLMNIRVLEGLLQPYKMKVSMATSGAEALDKIENMGYDIIFMDHMMPEMDGMETLQRIRQKQGNYFKNIPIVAVTANAVGGMREVFLNAGFQDFIAKPIEVSVLERVLRRVLPQGKMLSVSEDTDGGAEEKESAQASVDTAQEKGSAAAEKARAQESVNTVQRHTDLPQDTFNEQMGLTYCGGPENYIEILRMIDEKGQEDYDKISGFYEQKDWTNYSTLVHALKSTMRSVGVEKLSDMSKELEAAGKQGDEKFILGHHEEMMLEYQRILGLLHESGTVHQPEKQESLDGLEVLGEEELDQIARDFEDAAFAFDQEQMDMLAQRLSKCSYKGQPLSGMMQPILHKIEMSDYLSASEAVSRIRDRIAEGSE